MSSKTVRFEEDPLTIDNNNFREIIVYPLDGGKYADHSDEKYIIMEDATHVSVPLRTGKKMKKRKELDALVAHSATKRSCVGGGGQGKRCTAGGGISSQDQLLSESTDELQEEYWAAAGAPVVEGCKRSRGGGGVKSNRLSRRRRACSTAIVRTCTALLVFACVVATATVVWLFIDVRQQITSLRSELNQVVASNQGVPEALQNCHSISHGLQQNQTSLVLQLDNLRSKLENYTQQITNLETGLQQVKDRLKANPELVNVPNDIKTLKDSFAQFGSRFNENVNKLDAKTTSLELNITTLRSAINDLKMQQNSTTPATVSMKQVTDEKNAILDAIAQLTINVSNINLTLSNKIQWCSEDIAKDHKIIEDLQEMNQSFITKITTLGVEHTNLTNVVNKLSEQSIQTTNKTQQIDSRLVDIQTQYNDIRNNYNSLKDAVDNVTHEIENVSKSVPPIINLESQAIKRPEALALVRGDEEEKQRSKKYVNDNGNSFVVDLMPLDDTGHVLDDEMKIGEKSTQNKSSLTSLLSGNDEMIGAVTPSEKSVTDSIKITTSLSEKVTRLPTEKSIAEHRTDGLGLTTSMTSRVTTEATKKATPGKPKTLSVA